MHKVRFTEHAKRRLAQRGIGEDHVLRVLAVGERIEDYPNDTPHPSCLVLGWDGTRPLHVVAAEDAQSGQILVITAYQPDPDLWEPGSRRRKA
jgi:hypothetical protein